MQEQVFNEQPQSKPIGFFIDDERDLEVPYDLRNKDIEWHLFRSIRDLRKSEIFQTKRAEYICFDYYLKGGETGLDAAYTTIMHYNEMNWQLPIANFHSSDPSCNKRVAKEWYNNTGRFLDKELYNFIAKTEINKNTEIVNKMLSSYPNKQQVQKKKGLKRKGGRP